MVLGSYDVGAAEGEVRVVLSSCVAARCCMRRVSLGYGWLRDAPSPTGGC